MHNLPKNRSGKRHLTRTAEIGINLAEKVALSQEKARKIGYSQQHSVT